MIRVASPEQAVEQLAPTFDVAENVFSLRTLIVNLFFVGTGDEWVLVDAGLPKTTHLILHAAEQRFGPRSRPKAIVMTHGHFDHVGALRELAELWDVPVYAHELELPYLTGRASYPPPDPTVGGGMMARLSPLYPRGPVDLGDRVKPFPMDSTIPNMPGWNWIHTPGHSPGHVSLWRESDRCLIAGDAFVTTIQESAQSAMTCQPVEVHGPPKYFTQDWAAAYVSVQRLAGLEPSVAATGHGLPMSGDQLLEQLHGLAANFAERAVPAKGRYVNEAASFDINGPVSVPPPVSDPVTLGALAAVALGSAALTSALLGSEQKTRA
ncbi:MAG TPA: MBL fold metallo-hydrolase [Tepidisphaeraceae bacterium]|jgi:glyoxylase-like metal-dependent hydrolase (beta-lactamase superfamily II)